mmetsp:Transcript_1891/g.4234  ORF Transcript_1891/g.4234 Transcript_1891/m.4234 type:complete len:244 (+) Transcript_1891:360-1091(+)
MRNIVLQIVHHLLHCHQLGGSVLLLQSLNSRLERGTLKLRRFFCSGPCSGLSLHPRLLLGIFPLPALLYFPGDAVGLRLGLSLGLILGHELCCRSRPKPLRQQFLHRLCSLRSFGPQLRLEVGNAREARVQGAMRGGGSSGRHAALLLRLVRRNARKEVAGTRVQGAGTRVQGPCWRREKPRRRTAARRRRRYGHPGSQMCRLRRRRQAARRRRRCRHPSSQGRRRRDGPLLHRGGNNALRRK